MLCRPDAVSCLGDLQNGVSSFPLALHGERVRVRGAVNTTLIPDPPPCAKRREQKRHYPKDNLERSAHGLRRN